MILVKRVCSHSVLSHLLNLLIFKDRDHLTLTPYMTQYTGLITQAIKFHAKNQQYDSTSTPKKKWNCFNYQGFGLFIWTDQVHDFVFRVSIASMSLVQRNIQCTRLSVALLVLN